MLVKVNVTARDIELGEPGDPGLCPLARAIGRRIPKDDIVEVYGGRAHFASIVGDRAIDLPIAACQFYDWFDKGKEVSPITFQINIPNELLKRRPKP